MRRKSDFVTNSSSVSFIISDGRKNREEPLKISIPVEVSVEDFEWVKRINNMEEYEKFLDEWFGYENYEHPQDKEIREALEKGETIIVFEAQDYNTVFETVLCKEGLEDKNVPEGVTILYGTGGY